MCVGMYLAVSFPRIVVLASQVAQWRQARKDADETLVASLELLLRKHAKVTAREGGLSSSGLDRTGRAATSVTNAFMHTNYCT